MSADQTQQAFVVPPPFDDSSTGDCILSTPEGANFKVHRSTLSIASPVFADMFNMPQGEKSTDNIPIISVTEDAKTLTTLLNALYPVDPPIINDFDLVLSVVEACDKYSIKMGRLRRCLDSRGLLAEAETKLEHGLRMYALAWRLGLEEETKMASRYIHAADLRDRTVASLLLRESGSLNSITELWDLRTQRELALHALIDRLPIRLCLCVNCGGRDGSLRIMFNEYIEANYATKISALRTHFRTALQAPYPTFTDIATFLPAHRNIFCAGCSGIAALQTIEAHKKIHKAVAEYPQEVSGKLLKN